MSCIRQTGRGNRCDGFTLLETIIAMSLVSLLMLVVWSLFGIYTKLESKGVAAAQETSLLRAIHRQMRDDLLRAIPIDPFQPLSMVDEMSTESGANKPALPNGFLVGTKTEIHFAIIDRTAGSPRMSSRIVSYQAPSMGSGSLPEGGADSFSAEPPQGHSDFLGLERFSSGLERHVQSWTQFSDRRSLDDSVSGGFSTSPSLTLDDNDLLVIGPPDELTDSDSNETTETPKTIDPVPEIRRYQFRYFDGVTWVDQWDSAAMGRLPMAIEVELDVENSEDRRSDEQADESELVALSGEEANADTIDLESDRLQSDNDGRLQYRWVIAIDAAMPPEALPSESPIGDDEVLPIDDDEMWPINDDEVWPINDDEVWP